ncbi:MAG: PAS domain-containing protein [Vicinamibacteria bacterium]|nr:PAS domain-containing protein [Vicinamibacteria bacterium]
MKRQSGARAPRPDLAPLLAALDDIVFEFDARGTFLQAWARNAQKLSRPRRSLIGRTLDEVLGEAAAKPFVEAFSRVLASGQAEEMQYPLEVREGRRWFSGRLSRVTRGRRRTVVALIRDITESRATSEALAAARRRLEQGEAQYRALVEYASDGIFVADRGGRYIEVNSRACELVGYSREELLRMSVPELVPADLAAGIADQFEQMARGRALFFEYELKRKDGSLVATELSTRMLEDGRVLAIVRDISARRRADRELRQSQHRLDLIFDNTSDLQVLIRVEPGGRLVVEMANRAFHALLLQAFGVDDVDVVGRDRTDALTAIGVRPEEIERERPHFERVIRTRERADYTIDVPGPCGQRVLEVSIVPVVEDGAQACSHVLWTARDITDRVRVTARLAASKRRLSQILDALFGFVGLFDRDGKLLYCNQAPLAAASLAPEDVLGRPFWEAPWWRHSASERERLKDVLRRAAAGETVRFEATAQFGERLASVDQSYGPLRDDQGAITGVIGFAVDVSERVRTEAALRSSLQEKEILLREIHHRVKNNLQIVGSLLYFHSRKMEGDAAQAVLRDVQARLEAMSLVHASLYEAADLAAVDFVAYARSMAEQVVGVHGSVARRVQVTVDAASGPWSLPLERALPLGLALNELLVNALKYAFPGDRAGTVAVRFSASDDELEASVIDDGVGASDDARSTAGFGLRMVHALAEQLGGRASFDFGAGTRARLFIPRSPRPSA